MKFVLGVALICAIYCSAEATDATPKVQIYSRNVGELGKPNTLICHVSGFHPPNIKLELQKNGQDIEEAQQSDLAFHQGWHFHLTKFVPFTPQSGEHYSCKVEHSTLKEPKSFSWTPDM
ncbi:beta-2-microglobulin-like [Polyodon spathula]|uniref:beta-2-microglobulin-like n=1 Tax=Polyodon spathula TaxID=7913 RepID=UPI001B7EF91F|nr:beta-2-microglobulin-like [Polyodon spathula]XP_041092714.1 beta-2-microglobulin-like [Polyodon spathula]